MDGDGWMDCTADCFLQVMLSCSMQLQAACLSEVTVVAPLTQVFLQPRAKRFTKLVGEGERWVAQSKSAMHRRASRGLLFSAGRAGSTGPEADWSVGVWERGETGGSGKRASACGKRKLT